MMRWPRAAGTTLFFALLLAARATVAQPTIAEPRPITAAERAAVAMAMDYLDRGIEVWWDHLAEAAPLRTLDRETALREIAVRVGPTAGSVWQLQTPGLRYDDPIAIFSVTFSSGLEETLLFEMVHDNGWRLHTLRALVDPAEVFAGRATSSTPPANTRKHLPTGSPVASLLLAFAVLLIAHRARGQQPAWRSAAGLAVLALATLSCSSEPINTDRAPSTDEIPLHRLDNLFDLRQELATAAPPSEDVLSIARATTGLTRDVVSLWLAQAQLYRADLPAAEASLALVPALSPLPLAALLRARLAFLQVDEAETFLQYEYAIRQGPEHDGLQLEIGDARTLLGFTDQAEIIFKLLARMGSRLGEIYYWLATVAASNGQSDEGEALVRTGWSLRPIPRSVLFANPLLATLAARPSLLGLFDLDQQDEPPVPRRELGSSGVEPLAVPTSSTATLMGDYLILAFGNRRIIVPGGGALAPTDTPILDAAIATEQQQREVLERVDKITAAVQSSGISGLLRRETETCAAALANHERWDALEALTRGIDEQVDRVRPILVKLRARALQELGRKNASRDLLVALARSDIANSRRDPSTLFQLADSMAEDGNYDLAIKLVQKAQRISPQRLSNRRLRLYEMEKRLADDPKRITTAHFDLVYPRATGERYPNQVGLVLEAERVRLGHWIKIPASHRIEVQLFPVDAFLRAYSSSVAVVGIFDGRVRVPLADLRSLHPALVSILSHEVAHAMIAGATNDNAPRWLHEGLAQHVEMTATSINPYPDLQATGRTLSLPVVEAILAGFGEAQFVDLAYSEAAWLVHGIEARFGVAGIHRLLDAFKRGPDTEQAVQRAFGKTFSAFEDTLIDWAVREAPATWPTTQRRYDQELEEDLIRRSGREKRPTKPTVGTTRYREKKLRQADRHEQAIRDWHRAYTRATAAVKSALGPVVAAFRDEGQADGFDPRVCTRLRDALNSSLADPAVLSPPDRALAAALETAYASFNNMARACLQGQDAQVRAELATAEKGLGRAAYLLQPYGLRP